MKKYIKFALIASIMFLLTGCTSNPLSVEELKENEEVISYFAQRNVFITDIELEKRQTNKEKKEDIAYVKIKAENEFTILEGTYIIESSFFDEGGWNVMGVGCNKGGTYKPKDKIMYDVSAEYLDASAVEYTNYEIIQYDEEQEEYRGNLYFTVDYKGDFATISENYSVELIFDIYEGEWIANADNILIDGEYEIFIEDGVYTFKDSNQTHPNYFELTFTDVNARLTYYEWKDYLGSEIGYHEYNLGISNYRIDDGGIVLEEFGNIYSWKPNFKICPDGIFYDYTRKSSDKPNYKQELEKVD